jgi:hypothetical protein
VNTPLLVRHPAPNPTESLVGYALRLSEKNGYVSPWSLCQLAGLRQRELQTTGIGIERLAAIANCSASELSQIAFTSASNRRLHALLGHRLTPTDLNIAEPKLCPQCVAEKGFIEAHWHLELAVACPIHLCLTTSHCPICAKRLRWFRPGMLECECGGSLLESETSSISQPETGLLDLIRRKALGEPASKESTVSLPKDDLMAMTLRSILTVIRVLGKYRLIADEGTATTDELQIVLAASRVLMDWPLNFITLLEKLGEKLPAAIAGGVGKQFEGIYRALFRSRAIEQGHTDFLRIAFLDFALNHWGRGYVDHKLIKERGDAVPKRFLTQTEFATFIGVRQVTAARLLKGSKLSATRVKCGKANRILVDANLIAISRTAPGNVFRKREAAKRLGISVSVLHALKEAGIYEVNNLPSNRAGFHELDLKAFSEKFFALASEINPHGPTDIACITLKLVVCGCHDSTATKLNVLRAILTNKIAIVGNTNGTTGGLLLDRFIYREFVVNVRLSAARNASVH